MLFKPAPSISLAITLFGTLWLTPGNSFELPGVDRLLGTENPLVDFPDKLPATAALQTHYELNDFYRFRKGPQRHEYWIVDGGGLGLVRWRSVWFGARYSKNHFQIEQREVYEKKDALDGLRSDEHMAAALAWRHRNLEWRSLIGKFNNRVEGGIEVRCHFKRIRSIAGRVWLTYGTLDLSQKFEASTFFFPFASRDEGADLEMNLDINRDHEVHLGYGNRKLVGMETHPEQNNILYINRWHAEGSAKRTKTPRLDLRFRYESGDFNLAMTLDETRYLEIRDLALRRYKMEAGWGLLPTMRVALGMERWRLDSDYPSYIDVWPFTVWDIFTATRYRLIAADKTWDIFYTKVDWTVSPLAPLDLNLGVQWEWWRDDGRLFWKERVPVIPPFFFRYQSHENSLDWSFTNGLQIDLDLAWKMASSWTLHFDGRLVAPLEWRKHQASPTPDPAPAPVSTKSHAWGGLNLKASVDIGW
ncbi:MAG: hypothetical protein KJ970_20830 [Candidatus Eisenbacteria bacterium]|uniref:Uncharacterized protein n=1 Tax=Eiseniibacteriota bacterium TaxID=2212470 RepID=A0A948S1U7_UNCEI|nr:hypothetical protein [Candidatus Eisenbacteria bacterium]MBU1947179.1 hypothetical protein [Candidatus Eisenbacteria bacterium]MBU2693372.1 hypothetical protein [Candidatus Eisenbacteria bacterium]